ncbi:MAG: SUMF1/EgtB/PvdO family nonheme iron enzyme [bacterium]
MGCRLSNTGSIFILIFLFFSFLPAPASSKMAKFGYDQSFAVLIGLDDYAHWPPDQYSMNSIRGMEKFLKKQGFKIKKVTGSKVTRKNLKKLFTEDLQKPGVIRKNSRVVVMFTGHLKTVSYENNVEQAFLVPYDARKLGVGRLIIYGDFMGWADSLPSDHVLVIIGGCYSAPGIYIPPESYGKHRYLHPLGKNYIHLIENDLTKRGRRFSRLMLTSGRTGDKLYKDAFHGMRNLFGHLIWGVDNGIADYDKNGIISFDELGRYLEREVYRESQQIQRPLYGGFSDNHNGEFLFASGKSPVRKRLIREKAGGTLKLFVNVKGARVSVDSQRFYSSGKVGQPLRIKLMKGKHKIEVTAKDRLPFSRSITVPHNAPTRIMKADLELVSGEAMGAMVYIPNSSFIFGGTKEGISGNKVLLDGFYIGKYEVTNREYLDFVKATSRKKPPCMDDKCFKGDDKPVVCISWKDAQSYALWKTKVTGQLYRLPTEAEWERVAKGTGDYLYPWGNGGPVERGIVKANYDTGKGGIQKECTSSVRHFIKDRTREGAYGLAGNVSEWTADWYAPLVPDFNKAGPEKNPQGPARGKKKVVRGGSWLKNKDCLSNSYRSGMSPESSSSDIGFRLVREP